MKKESHAAHIYVKKKFVANASTWTRSLRPLARRVSREIGATVDVPCHLIQFCKGRWVQRRASRPQDLGIGVMAAPAPAPKWMQRPDKRAGGCAAKTSRHHTHPFPKSHTALFLVPLPSRQFQQTNKYDAKNVQNAVTKANATCTSQRVVAVSFWCSPPIFVTTTINPTVHIN